MKIPAKAIKKTSKIAMGDINKQINKSKIRFVKLIGYFELLFNKKSSDEYIFVYISLFLINLLSIKNVNFLLLKM